MLVSEPSRPIVHTSHVRNKNAVPTRPSLCLSHPVRWVCRSFERTYLKYSILGMTVQRRTSSLFALSQTASHCRRTALPFAVQNIQLDLNLYVVCVSSSQSNFVIDENWVRQLYPPLCVISKGSVLVLESALYLHEDDFAVEPHKAIRTAVYPWLLWQHPYSLLKKSAWEHYSAEVFVK